MTATHELEKTIDLPSNLTLQSIRFEEAIVEISEKNQHRFRLLGMYSDNVEREINDLAGVTYTIEFPNIIALPNFEIVTTNIPGQSKLTASIENLTATVRYDVVEDIALNQTIIADYFATFEQTGPIDLKWKSLLEYNSNEFTLESSLDNINFTQINQQNALGTSYDVVNYNYTDNTTENLIYYRLKAFDTFNNIVFEETIVVDRNALSNPEFNIEKRFTIYPNPVLANNFSIKLNKGIESFSLKLFDITGNLILEQNNLSSNGSNDVEIQLPNKLSEGIYLVQIKTNEFVRTEKLIIQN
ncbi:MAG: T9SS type A sorting domain-containing protein [Flavobacterium sp.]|nr:T9SS type A sorting domain-containing protein [Flavobacterium sp.]